jgi:hypothetical protein
MSAHLSVHTSSEDCPRPAGVRKEGSQHTGYEEHCYSVYLVIGSFKQRMGLLRTSSTDTSKVWNGGRGTTREFGWTKTAFNGLIFFSHRVSLCNLG